MGGSEVWWAEPKHTRDTHGVSQLDLVLSHPPRPCVFLVHWTVLLGTLYVSLNSLVSKLAPAPPLEPNIIVLCVLVIVAAHQHAFPQNKPD